MTTGTIVVLMGCVGLLFAAGVTTLCTLALLWSFQKLRPQEELQAEVSGLRAMVETLEAQIIRLRTQKAGARSASKKAQTAESEPESEEEGFLDGLTEADKALFR